MSHICQSMDSILPNKKETVKILPNTHKRLPKWRNFAKSGHTGGEKYQKSPTDVRLIDNEREKERER